jgi:hypothetical protein
VLALVLSLWFKHASLFALGVGGEEEKVLKHQDEQIFVSLFLVFSQFSLLRVRERDTDSGGRESVREYLYK